MPTKFTLPKKELTFHIDIIGEKSGERYKGSFTYQRLNLGQARKARCERTRLMEDLKNLDDETRVMCEAISWLEEGLISAPPWWSDPWELYDYNLITEIYSNVIDFENNFTRQIEDIGSQIVEPIEKLPQQEDEEQGLMVEDDEFKE